MARIVLVTTNTQKFNEYCVRFRQYGIPVSQVTSADAAGELAHLKDAIAVLREESTLVDLAGNPITSFLHLQPVVNRTTLWVSELDDTGAIARVVYQRSIAGHLDLDRKRSDAHVFGWDDIFVVGSTMQTYHEMRTRGLKVSARDLVIADFARNALWYRSRTDLRWQPLQLARSIDFAVDACEVIENHPLFDMLPQQHGLRYVLQNVVDSGLFFRAAKNRREKNYWMPGLNAGIPLVPKRDDVHEATFMFHDIMHFAFPDLVFDGQGPASHEHRNTYIIHRMMSEAFTLVLADMAFIDVLHAQAVDYDFSRRAIFPLFQSLPKATPWLEHIAAVLRANAAYCLTGNTTPYYSLGAAPVALANFENKYASFFIADYRWTAHNLSSMVSAGNERGAAWWQLTAPIRATLPVEIDTIDGWVQRMRAAHVDFASLPAIVDYIFSQYVQRLTRLASVAPARASPAQRLTYAFKRYMLGQLAIFVVYDFLPEARYFATKLVAALATEELLDLATVTRLRSFYEQFVTLLVARSLISDDDAAVYRECYPLFEPFYVNYDASTSDTILDTARAMLQL